MKTAKELEIAIAILEKKVDASIEFYRSLQKKPLPNIIDIADYTADSIGGIIKLTDAETMGKWNKRAINIRSVNLELRKFESAVMSTLTKGSHAILAGEFLRIISLFEWLLSHLGEITIIVYEVAKILFKSGKKVIEQMGEKVIKDTFSGRYVYAYLRFMVDPLGASKRAAVAAKLDAERLSERIAEFAIFLLSVTVVGVLVKYLNRVVDAVGEYDYYKTLVPLVKLRSDAIDGLQAKAFPQGKGRVRRVRRTRVAP